jgi:glycosyltransferase involved in cell wall biosynthesis
MPVKNGERFLAEAIASVRAQTFTDWELLIVDDGSTDSSPAIAARAAAADARISVVATAPGPSGAAAARNIGLDTASGTFVAFLDADDLYEKDKLAVEVALLERNPTAAMTYGPARWFFEDQPGRDWTESMRGFANALHQPPELLRRVILDRESQVPCTCAVLIRQSALADVDGFLERLSLYEDQTLWVKLMLRYPTYVHDAVLCRYRQHSDSASAQAETAGAYDRHRPHPARLDFLEWIEREAGLSSNDPRLQQALRLAFAPYPGHGRSLTIGDRLVMARRGFKRAANRLRRRAELGLAGKRSG